MLRVLMTSEADFDLLRQEGVSEAGVDFVRRLLSRDPHARPNERECFQHPWIADIPDVDEYEDDGFQSDGRDDLSAIGEDLEYELDASQLSLNDHLAAHDSGDLDEMAQSKRQRIDAPPADIHYPSLPNLESMRELQPSYKPSAQRLFDDIPPSALRSSGVLPADPRALERDDLNFQDFVSSTGESIISEDNSMDSVLSLPENPTGDSAPSLMGTENLVGQLNVNSTWHPGSPNIPLAVTTPPRQLSPETVKESNGSHDQDAHRQSSASDATPKASKFTRRIEIPTPDPNQENLGGNTSDRNRTLVHELKRDPGQVFDIELATTVDAQTGKELRELPVGMDWEPGSDSSRECDPSMVSQTVSIAQFSKPRPVLGKLTTLPGSIANLSIRLEGRMTSWGRGRLTTVRYPDGMDSRIPKYALEVTFWAPGIEARIAAGEDWLDVPSVIAILSTKTREHIWVNDMRLSRGSQGNNGREEVHFGKLYSGDIITIYRDSTQFLKFQCEFYHGDSARPRPGTEKPFVVQKQLISKTVQNGIGGNSEQTAEILK